MSFDAAWLDLRAGADARARDPGLLAAARAVLRAVPRAVDLGAGTGATVRAFEVAGAVGVDWRLLDNDPALLAIARARHGARIEPVLADLGDPSALPLEDAGLVTASALLDLMPAAWIDAFADRLAGLGVGLYAALSYDGTMGWEPAHAGDAAVTAAFNAHQRTDKGLGPALGPSAADAMAAALRTRGFRVRTAASSWRLGPADAALQRELVAGVAAAAAEAGAPGAGAWGQARRAASGSARCTVGHVDLLALPPGASAQSNTTSESSP